MRVWVTARSSPVQNGALLPKQNSVVCTQDVQRKVFKVGQLVPYACACTCITTKIWMCIVNHRQDVGFKNNRFCSGDFLPRIVEMFFWQAVNKTFDMDGENVVEQIEKMVLPDFHGKNMQGL